MTSSPDGTMTALTVAPDAPSGFRSADVPVPEARPDEVLVRVAVASLNFLDLAYSAARLPPGTVGGVDAAGVVVAAASDGSGPPVGALVATFAGTGAWAPWRAVPAADVAVVPDTVDLAVAAALPAAGVTALQAVRALGSLVGRRVLVTGAAGGVGRFAVQLAALAGADVTALVGRSGRGRSLSGLPGVRVVDDVAACGTVDGVLDLVGGDLLARAFALVAPGGRALAIGAASGSTTTFDLEAERNRGGGRWLTPFAVAGPFGPDLAVLLDLVARGRLDVRLGWDGDWRDLDRALAALRDRTVEGKAVLRVTTDDGTPR